MIDAGSTGSRAYVYEIKGSQIHSKGKLKIEPGLASFEKNLPGIEPYINKLLEFAKEQIGDGTPIHQVSVRLEATGGMRVLSKTSQKRIMTATRKALQQSGFKFVLAEIITGEQEGIYEWKAVNFLLGLLNEPNQQTVGLVEMGGSSLQVTFKDGPELFAKTYHEFGENTSWHGLAQKACIQIPLEYARCRKSLVAGLKTVQKPNLKGQFYLVDEFRELTALLDEKKISSEILDRRGVEICYLSLSDLKKKFPEYSGKYLPRLCYQTAYMSVALEKVGFKRTQELISVKEIKGTALSWTLGSVIDNMLSSQNAVAMP
jgi:hypothetical protein